MNSLHFFYILVLLSSSCLTLQPPKGNAKPNTYTNPVFEPILADPTVIRDPSTGYFYAYGTQDDWGDGNGSRIVPVLKSSNLVDWTVEGQAFSSKPNWKTSGGIWAPEVVHIDGKFLMYYANSVWGDPNPAIGVAVSDNPTGPFTDKGKLFDSKEIDVPNSIDPFYWEEEGQKYLFWGSYSNRPTQGTYGIGLSADGLDVPDLSDKFKIAAGDFEAIVLHKRDGFYYFIGSKGHCCNGVNSDYRLLVARSKNLKGPYLDKEGRDIRERGNGTLLLKGNGTFVGTGHGSRIITDDLQNDWILYHGIDVKTGKVSSGATRRVLMLDRIIWENGWPTIEGNTASAVEKERPYFSKYINEKI